MHHPATGGRGLLAEFGTTAYNSTGFLDAGGKGWDGDQGRCYGGTVQLREIPGVCGLEGPSSPLEVGWGFGDFTSSSKCVVRRTLWLVPADSTPYVVLFLFVTEVGLMGAEAFF